MALPCGDAWSLGIVGVWAANMLGNKTAAASPRTLRIIKLPPSARDGGGAPPHGFELPRPEEGGRKPQVTPWPEVTAGPCVTGVSRGDSLGWSRLPRPQRTSSILCVP